MRIYTSVNWVSIGLGNGLSPARRQAITWTSAELLSSWPLGTNFSEVNFWKCHMVWIVFKFAAITLWWHHNERDGVSNHRCLDCLLLKPFVQVQIKETPKLCVTGLCEGKHRSPVDSPPKGNAENVSIWWRHHYLIMWKCFRYDHKP